MKRILPLIILFVISLAFIAAYFKSESLLKYDFDNEVDRFANEIEKQLQGKKGKLEIDLEKPDDMESSILDKIRDIILVKIADIKGMRLVVNEDEREKIIEDIREEMNHSPIYRGSPGSLLGEGEYPDHKISGRFEWIKEGKQFQFTEGKFIDMKTQTAISLPPYKFYHPDYIQHLRNSKKAMGISSVVSSGVFVLYLLFLLVILTIQFRIRRRMGTIVSQVNAFIDNKHFVAAEKYLNYALHYDPENPFLHDLKTKLEALSFGDVKKAQMAWEIYQKASEYKEKNMQGKILELSDDIQKYVDYNPELKALSYEIEERGKVKSAVEEAEALEEQGKLVSALKSIENLDNEDAVAIKERIQKKMDEIKQEINRVGQMIKAGKIDEAEAKIREVLSRNSEDQRAIKIDEILKEAKSPSLIKLIPVEGFGKYYIIPKREIIIGRKEGDIVIPHPMVSNPHLKITIMKKDAVLEDLSSKNGTYVAGEKVRKVSIEDGDIINLAGKVKLVGHLCEDTGAGIEADRTLSSGAAKEKNIGGLILEEEDKRWIVLKKRCYIKALDMEIVFTGNYIICRNEQSNMEIEGNEMLAGDYFPLIPGRIKAQNWEYRMEVIK